MSLFIFDWKELLNTISSLFAIGELAMIGKLSEEVLQAILEPFPSIFCDR